MHTRDVLRGRRGWDATMSGNLRNATTANRKATRTKSVLTPRYVCMCSRAHKNETLVMSKSV